MELALSEIVHIKDVKVSRVIDPSAIKYTKKDDIYVAEYCDTEKSEGLFEFSIPEVVISLASHTDVRKLSSIEASGLKDKEGNLMPMKGFPYRVGNAVKVSVKGYDLEIYDSHHMFAKAGN